MASEPSIVTENNVTLCGAELETAFIAHANELFAMRASRVPRHFFASFYLSVLRVCTDEYSGTTQQILSARINVCIRTLIKNLEMTSSAAETWRLKLEERKGCGSRHSSKLGELQAERIYFCNICLRRHGLVNFLAGVTLGG